MPTIPDGDISVDFVRLHKGGQMVGTPPCLIRIVHVPTGMSVAVTDRRGQHRAREYALTMLKMMVEDFG